MLVFHFHALGFVCQSEKKVSDSMNEGTDQREIPLVTFSILLTVPRPYCLLIASVKNRDLLTGKLEYCVQLEALSIFTIPVHCDFVCTLSKIFSAADAG